MSVDDTICRVIAKLPLASLLVSQVSLGTSPLGGMKNIYGYDVPHERAVATVVRCLESSIRFVDTSNEYGQGESELRIGEALRAHGRPADLVLASKADPAPGSRVFDGPRVWESFRESVARLGVERLEVFYLHDPERFDIDYMLAPGGAVEAMREIKEAGLADVVGVAGGDVDAMRHYIRTGVFDVLLNHSRYTLLDRSADALIDESIELGLAFVNAAPYASGMLAKPAAESPRYQYRAPDSKVVDTVAWLRAVCHEFDVPLAALALQFSMRDPRVTSTVVGISSPERIDELERNAEIAIPEEIWGVVESGLAAQLRP